MIYWMKNCLKQVSNGIMRRILKTGFVKYKQFLIAVHDAAVHFNIDKLRYYTTTGRFEDDNQPVKITRRQSTCYTKTPPHPQSVQGSKKRKKIKQRNKRVLYDPILLMFIFQYLFCCVEVF